MRALKVLEVARLQPGPAPARPRPSCWVTGGAEHSALPGWMEAEGMEAPACCPLAQRQPLPSGQEHIQGSSAGRSSRSERAPSGPRQDPPEL